MRGVRYVLHSAGCQRPQYPGAHSQACKTSNASQDRPLQDQLSSDAEPSRTERHSCRQLPGPNARSGERQIRDVDAPDQEHERGAAPQQIEDAADVAGQGVLERRHGGVHAQFGQAELGKAPEVRSIQCIDLRPDLLDRGIGPEAADMVKAVAGARVVRPLRRGEGERDPELDRVTSSAARGRRCRGRRTRSRAASRRRWYSAAPSSRVEGLVRPLPGHRHRAAARVRGSG